MIRPTDRWLAIAVAATAFAVYLATLCPTVYIGDSGELTGVAWSFGVAHPPGYPLFTLLYGALVHALPLGNPALIANGITATLAAATIGVLFLAIRRLGVAANAAAAAVVGLTVARQFWYQAVSVEVYALDGFLLASFLALAISLATSPAAAWTQRRWICSGLAAGLSCGHRPVNLLYIALIALWVELRRRKLDSRPRPSGWLIALAAATATGAVFVYLPIAAASNPPLNMGDPDSWERFWSVVSAQPYQRHIQSGTLELTLERLRLAATGLPLQLGATFALALWGLMRLRLTGHPHRQLGWLLAVAVVANLAFASTYNILDNDGFFQPALLALTVLAAAGWQDVIPRLGHTGSATALALILAALPATWSWRGLDLSGERTAETYARDLLGSAEPGALVLVEGDTARAALSYLQTLGERPDVAVLSRSMLLPWHIEEVRRRAPQFDLPPLSDTDDPVAWLRALARSQLLDRGRPIYITTPGAGPLQELLDPDLLQRADLLPAGLLSRIVVQPFARQALVDRAAKFWDDRSIPLPRSARRDPQLLILPVHYVRARFILATELLKQNRLQDAAQHFAVLASSDADERDERIAAAYRAIGRPLTSRRFAQRAAEALRLIKAGATAPQIMGQVR